MAIAPAPRSPDGISSDCADARAWTEARGPAFRSGLPEARTCVAPSCPGRDDLTSRCGGDVEILRRGRGECRPSRPCSLKETDEDWIAAHQVAARGNERGTTRNKPGFKTLSRLLQEASTYKLTKRLVCTACSATGIGGWIEDQGKAKLAPCSDAPRVLVQIEKRRMHWPRRSSRQGLHGSRGDHPTEYDRKTLIQGL